MFLPSMFFACVLTAALTLLLAGYACWYYWSDEIKELQTRLDEQIADNYKNRILIERYQQSQKLLHAQIAELQLELEIGLEREPDAT